MSRTTDIARLAELETIFAAAGGRGVELADEIDELRARLAPRTFYRRVIQVEILSEEPYGEDDLTQIGEDIMEGDCSGTILTDTSETVDGPTMARLLVAQGSDPEFFQLDAEGSNLDGDPGYDFDDEDA